MAASLSIWLSLVLLVVCTVAAPSGAPRYRLKSIAREQYLRVTPEGQVQVDGDKLTAEGREQTCFTVYSPTRRDVELRNQIGMEEFTVVVDSNGDVLALSEDDMEASESGSGVTYTKVFQQQRSRRVRGAVYFQVRVEDKICYLHFDDNGHSENACSEDAAEMLEVFVLESC